MKYCRKCNQPIAKEAMFCENCGQNQNVKISSKTNLVTLKKIYADENAKSGLIYGLIAIPTSLISIIGFPISIAGIRISTKGLS